MTKRIALMMAVLCVGVLATVSCSRSDIKTMTVNVPQMTTARDVRIVTNAALEEVVGIYERTPSTYEVDLSKKLVIYHESPRLLDPAYLNHIKSRLAEVGFGGDVISVQHDPLPTIRTANGLMRMWPDRHTAVISVSDMATKTDANIVVDAIAYARLGADDPRVSTDADSRQVTAIYNALYLARKNVEQAIACVGFDANTVPARLGEKDSVPHGWKPVKL